MKRLLLFGALSLTLLASCSRRSRVDDAPVFFDRQASIEVEVYDPETNLVWQDVSVRIVQADQEWSGCLCVNPVVDDYYFTDEFGIVFFTAADLAIADVGFLEDDSGRAVISPDFREDEVTVLLEVSAPGLGTVFQSVDLNWDEPRVFVSVPF